MCGSRGKAPTSKLKSQIMLVLRLSNSSLSTRDSKAVLVSEVEAGGLYPVSIMNKRFGHELHYFYKEPFKFVIKKITHKLVIYSTSDVKSYPSTLSIAVFFSLGCNP